MPKYLVDIHVGTVTLTVSAKTFPEARRKALSASGLPRELCDPRTVIVKAIRDE